MTILDAPDSEFRSNIDHLIKPMHPEIKAKWLEALRSGRYEQGHAFLRDVEDNFCCLGVMCDIVAPLDWFEGGDEGSRSHQDGDHYPSAAVLDGVLIDTKVAKRLAMLNDSGLSFAEIADLIERNL